MEVRLQDSPYDPSLLVQLPPTMKRADLCYQRDTIEVVV